MKFPREKYNYAIIISERAISIPYEEFSCSWRCGNRFCWREFHSKKLLENKNYFLQTLATNPIDFYYLKSWVSPIECVFIEYMRNPSWFRGCLEILVEVGKGKDLSFFGFALLPVLPPPSASSSSYGRAIKHNLLVWLGSCAWCMLESLLFLACTRALWGALERL
jgi:hypothetical protein